MLYEMFWNQNSEYHAKNVKCSHSKFGNWATIFPSSHTNISAALCTGKNAIQKLVLSSYFFCVDHEIVYTPFAFVFIVTVVYPRFWVTTHDY